MTDLWEVVDKYPTFSKATECELEKLPPLVS